MAAPSVDSLLTHARWVEGFARALVREDADDVAQDAWMAAIQNAPADASRGWFATVMRNAARMRFRSDSRRRAREETVTHEAPLTPDELAHRMDMQRRLASLVLALDEPQRSTIILVFYEGLSPAEIARQQGVPATTVRSRVRAALVTLRQRLDAEEGGNRSRWQLALAPIAAVKLPAAASPTPVIAAAIALVTIVAIIAILATRSSSSATSSAASSTPAQPVATAPRATSTTSVAAATSSTTSPSTTPSTSANAGSNTADPWSQPLGPSSDDDEDPGGGRAVITPAFLKAERLMMRHLDECYEIATKSGRTVRGVVAIEVALTTHPRTNAEVTFKDGTTVKDPETLECVRENTRVIEDEIDRLRAKGETIEGRIEIHVSREMPPPPEKKEEWPSDTESPTCPAGTKLAGKHRDRQWCEQPDGTRHGPTWRWDEKGRLVIIGSYEHGEMQNSIRMHDPDPD